ncbi:uncharacterized protein [Primulina huaijiensis]|uniref:uncharacterized protein n=1 Tax=Primulina huaijiensis TaxID=1492673 RepID=UPI003CC76E44
MVHGSSQSQSSSGTTSRPSIVGASPRISATATTGMRQRRLGSGSSSDIDDSAGSGANMLRFYTEDVPGMRIRMSLCFIGFVTVLHVIGKFYRYRYEA